MLLLVLSNDEEYLKGLLYKIREETDVQAVIEDAQGLGEELIGSRVDVFSGVRWTSTGSHFDHALVVTLKSQEKLDKLRQLVTHEMDLSHSPEKGMMICLPSLEVPEEKSD